jgi:hypothetical protein
MARADRASCGSDSGPCSDGARSPGSNETIRLVNHWPWTVEERVRVYGDEVAVLDALARLQGGGLVHRVENVVFPARAATYYSRIDKPCSVAYSARLT